MSEQMECQYDNEPATNDGLCEECYAEVVYMNTCDNCMTDEHSVVIQGRINAYFHCNKCGDEWM